VDELDTLRKENEGLRNLIGHCWVHSGYPNCGYMEMTTEEKALYDAVIRQIVAEN